MLSFWADQETITSETLSIITTSCPLYQTAVVCPVTSSLSFHQQSKVLRPQGRGPCLEQPNNGGVSGRAANAALLKRLHQGGFAVVRRWFCKVLAGQHLVESNRISLLKRQENVLSAQQIFQSFVICMISCTADSIIRVLNKVCGGREGWVWTDFWL